MVSSVKLDFDDILLFSELKGSPVLINLIINQNLPPGNEHLYNLSRPERINKLEKLKTLGYITTKEVFCRTDEDPEKGGRKIIDWIDWSITKKGEEILKFLE